MKTTRERGWAHLVHRTEEWGMRVVLMVANPADANWDDVRAIVVTDMHDVGPHVLIKCRNRFDLREADLLSEPV